MVWVMTQCATAGVFIFIKAGNGVNCSMHFYYAHETHTVGKWVTDSTPETTPDYDAFWREFILL